MTNKTIHSNILVIALSLLFLAAGPVLGGPNDVEISDEQPCSLEGEACSEVTVRGNSLGNRELNCTFIQPWEVGEDPLEDLPVIVWANGWGWNNVEGEFTTLGYKPGLVKWALSGPYIVIAVNQWSVHESDVLQCLQWAMDNYEGIDDTAGIGLSGHSMGGGAIIKAGDGEPNGFAISATIPMNPWGPSWVDPGRQDGPMLLLGGSEDTTTPPESYEAVWEAVQSNGVGGINAVLIGGTHNSEAWGVDEEGNTLPTEEAQYYDFGHYQHVSELWWHYHLKGHKQSGRELKRLLDRHPWETRYAFTGDFKLPK